MKGQGAAFAIMMRRLERSYLFLISSGRLTMRRIGVGAENVLVTLYFSSMRSQSSGSNLRCMTPVLPSRNAMPMKPPGPEW